MRILYGETQRLQAAFAAANKRIQQMRVSILELVGDRKQAEAESARLRTALETEVKYHDEQAVFFSDLALPDEDAYLFHTKKSAMLRAALATPGDAAGEEK